MKKKSFQFSRQKTDYYFDADFSALKKILASDHVVVVTDQHVYDAHQKKLKGFDTIVLKPGEEYKNQDTVNSIIKQLIDYKADRKTVLIGLGGGVVTDLSGYAASVYMRGIRFGFVPTSILAMVDASIGGKNGVDVGLYKNLVGTINQPGFLLYDTSLLKSLPEAEWINGFAEIIKHACILDKKMFEELEKNDLKKYQKNKKALTDLIMRNALIKTKIVQKDEFEAGDRKLLNYGHTMGHAIENLYKLPHGHAISIGMVIAADFSKGLLRFKDRERVKNTLAKYGLTTEMNFDKEKSFEILSMDKKRAAGVMSYILLEKIGRGVVKPIPLDELKKLIAEIK